MTWLYWVLGIGYWVLGTEDWVLGIWKTFFQFLVPSPQRCTERLALSGAVGALVLSEAEVASRREGSRSVPNP
ncbi:MULTISPECIES: hypothetical protein [unclassified Nostoc]|uniref:hypothetical protein n=1 Tax=unclassified Nostoc TaxID=2593658 RepID=UPI002AD25CB5|nr:hypothetical protein [Nostoc sp. DedQUE03]MDZ7972843.1 hypothetical protein [Nostoc sp. DedQUE03]MDZ8045261.1 hypothetical protein [Nostoc sp. DedQUE02]